ncbi:polysaccharide deacetylase family protein [Polaribacter sp.]
MKLSRKRIIYPFYHFVKENDDVITKHLYKAKNKEEFIRDLHFFKKHFKSISQKDLLSKENYKKQFNFFLSFDDGLSNFYDVVMPILIKEKVFAINFINTNFIDNKALFFRYKINLLIERLSKKQLTKEEKNLVKKEIGSIVFNYGYLKELKYVDTILIDKLCRCLSINISNFLEIDTPYLTKQQIKILIEKGFYVGGHSKSHPYYLELSLKDQLEETLESVNFLKKTFNIDKLFFSFPFSDNGVSSDFFKETKKKNILTFGTAGIKDEVTEINNIQRIPMEYNTVYTAETIVKGELILYFIKRLLDKHIIKRK